ncbi:MAG: antibiotic biosynthesis monooxygenase [Oscillatoriophycideae cyanobacterium NC_groundwater_1537_Pr4_S-0.65um_50_18]|nr:antibiotic biosynthesis monooxygenase [Oscillatoriophycideae cyanobacterium NC_groundwater_1537_Pr4_S-0.65um_50_18]
MSEFQDFLRRKFAYVAIGEFKSGKFDEAKQLYEEAISSYQQGFKGTYLLQEPGTDRGISIIFWESAADMESNRTEAHEEILKKMMPLFARAPETAFYEVVCDIQPKEGE